GGLVFDGVGSPADQARVTSHSDFDIDRFTLSAWIKPDFQGTYYDRIITKGDDSNWALLRNSTGGALLFYVVTDSGWKGVWGSTFVNDNTWHHIGGTYDGTNVRLFIDGVEDPSSPTSVAGAPGMVYTSADILFGETSEGTPREPYEGGLDEVLIYDQALSPAEILNIAAPPVWLNNVVPGDVAGANGFGPIELEPVVGGYMIEVVETDGNAGYVDFYNHRPNAEEPEVYAILDVEMTTTTLGDLVAAFDALDGVAATTDHEMLDMIKSKLGDTDFEIFLTFDNLSTSLSDHQYFAWNLADFPDVVKPLAEASPPLCAWLPNSY
ncbi:hypothetical protein LCGC14_3104060, partial [marine sediment metagenome]